MQHSLYIVVRTAIVLPLVMLVQACLAPLEEEESSENPPIQSGNSEQNAHSVSFEPEDQVADRPEQVAGAFLVCTSGQVALASGPEVRACAVVDAGLRRLNCSSHDAVRAKFSDGYQERVAAGKSSKGSFWHFLFTLSRSEVSESVQAVSHCDNKVLNLVSRDVAFDPETSTVATMGQSIGDTKINHAGTGIEEVPQIPVYSNPNPSSSLVFVSSQAFKGNMKGLANADASCSQAARKAGLKGRFIALFSLYDAEARERVNPTLPVVNIKGEVVADAGGLWSGILKAAVAYDEYGHSVDGPVWTASNWRGQYVRTGPTVGSCYRWVDSSREMAATIGLSTSSGKEWFEAKTLPCARSAHLYCIEDTKI